MTFVFLAMIIPSSELARPQISCLSGLALVLATTLDRFLGERFLEISGADRPDRVLDALRAQGIDPAAAGLDRDILGALRDTRPQEPIGPVAQPVQPQA